MDIQVPRWEGFPHVLQTQQFDRMHLDPLFTLARRLIEDRRAGANGAWRTLGNGRVLQTLFHEPSSRTATSFIRAAMNLGMGVIDVRDPDTLSSEARGESFDDDVRVYSGPDDPASFRTADMLIIRHPDPNHVKRAAAIASMPVINAGNGTDQQPTQSLVDLYAIAYMLERLDDLHVGMAGDLQNGRTCRSLAYLLGKIGQRIRLTFIARPDLQMREDVCQFLNRHAIAYTQQTDYGDVLRNLDVLYIVARAPTQFTAAHLALLRRDARVLHPLPINSLVPGLSEIAPPLCDLARRQADPRLAWMAQSDFAIPVRMALLAAILAGHKA